MTNNTELESSAKLRSAGAAPERGAVEISVRGKIVRVPCVQVQGMSVLVSGTWLKVASLFDEGETVKDPESFCRDLAAAASETDIFKFVQQIPDTSRRYSFPFETDNVAAIPITTYDEWFSKQIETDVKQNIKKSAKRGVEVRVAQFDDEFVRGVVDIFNESPIRQGRPFWHYGKDFATVKREIAEGLDRSEFIGAYHGGELIGFIKLRRLGVTNDMVLIVAKQAHFERRPMNALIAKAVEVCAQRGVQYLTYAKMSYGHKSNSSLAEFKRRHGFQQIDFPRYFVPLTTTGRIAVALGLYRSLQEMLPEKVLDVAIRRRASAYAWLSRWMRRPPKGVTGAR
jgi:hypothetical protein